VAAPAVTTAWRVVLAALVLAICWLAFTPWPPAEVDTGWDKANHALAFAAFAVCARHAWPAAGLLPLMAAGLAFGGLIEIVQTMVPGRVAEWSDLAGDAAGLVIGLALDRLAGRRRRR
jgi:VanZ family protein